jgi:hypothetical protein
VEEDIFNEFKLENLRSKQDYHTGVQRLLLGVPLCRPHRAWFVRTHPDPSYL